MAEYKYATHLHQVQSALFDQDNTPGTAAPRSGIYRCNNCGREVASNQGEPLPPQNHHQHPAGTLVRWKLTVYADHRPASEQAG